MQRVVVPRRELHGDGPQSPCEVARIALPRHGGNADREPAPPPVPARIIGPRGVQTVLGLGVQVFWGRLLAGTVRVRGTAAETAFSFALLFDLLPLLCRTGGCRRLGSAEASVRLEDRQVRQRQRVAGILPQRCKQEPLALSVHARRTARPAPPGDERRSQVDARRARRGRGRPRGTAALGTEEGAVQRGGGGAGDSSLACELQGPRGLVALGFLG